MKNVTFAAWSPFAWHGIQLAIPSEWNPGKIIGDKKSGEVRLDDSQVVRIELEWKDARGDDRVGQIVDRYIEGLAKNAEKEKRPLNVQRGATGLHLDLPDMRNIEYFVYQARAIVHTLACYSPATDRLIFMRVMARHDETLDAVLPRVLNSLKDTPPDAPQPWALYDMTCASPPGYELDTFDLKSGHVRLAFLNDNIRLQIDRLSLAKIMLKNQTLEDWYRSFFQKDLRHIQIECQTEIADADDQRIAVTGHPKSRLHGLLQPLPFWNSRPRHYLAGRAWTHFTSNKIFAVQTFYRKKDAPPDIEAYARAVASVEPQK